VQGELYIGGAGVALGYLNGSAIHNNWLTNRIAKVSYVANGVPDGK
jgi:hypothetical protein